MSLRKAIEEVALNEQFNLKVKYDGTSEKGRGPTGIAYAIPSGHPCLLYTSPSPRDS